MKTFNFNKPCEELSFNEILSVLLEIGDIIEIGKFNSNSEFGYHINSYRETLYREIEDNTDNNEFELNCLMITWYISSKDKNLDKLKNQNSKTRNQLDFYFESAINLGLIELKFIEC